MSDRTVTSNNKDKEGQKIYTDGLYVLISLTDRHVGVNKGRGLQQIPSANQ